MAQPTMLVVHLHGKPEELGRQQGVLLKDRLLKSGQTVYASLRRLLPLAGLDHVLMKIGPTIVRSILNPAWLRLRPFVPSAYLDEIHGLASAVEFPPEVVELFYAIPELYPGLCSSGAFFGPATADGRLYHYRNLDWSLKFGVQDNAALLCYEPEGKLRFINIGWIGMLGVLTGVNERGISIGYITAESHYSTLDGIPAAFLCRKILEEAAHLDDAVQMIREAPRTLGYVYVIADALRREACAVETNVRRAVVFRDNDPQEQAVVYARSLAGCVCRTDIPMDPLIRIAQKFSRHNHTCSGLEMPYAAESYQRRYLPQLEQAQAHYGRMDADAVKAIAQATSDPTNLQSIVISFPELWVATAQGQEPAATQPFEWFDFHGPFDPDQWGELGVLTAHTLALR